MNREILGRLKKISERLKKNYNAEKRKNIGDQFILDIFENGISL